MPKQNELKIQLSSSFSPRHRNPIDDRIQFDSIADMLVFPESSLYDGLKTYCLENKKFYVYDSNNANLTATGKWREFTGGSGGSINISQEQGNAIVEKDDGIYSPNLVETVNGMKEVDDLQDLPVGSVVDMDWEQAPAHWIEIGENRTVYNIADYPTLAENIRQQKGSINFYGGDGITTFGIPSIEDVKEMSEGGSSKPSADEGNAIILGSDNNFYAKDLQPQIDELRVYEFPKATIVGNPTINHGQISGFSQNDYLRFPFIVGFEGRPFIINTEFTTGANVTNQQNIFDSDFGFAFAVRNSRFVIAMSSNGQTWDLGESVGTYAVQTNTTYKVRLSWDTQTYKVEYSTNGGETYTTDISKASTASLYPTQIYIGVGMNHGTVLNHFLGSINFNYCNLYIGNDLVWQGMDDLGRLNVDVSNISPEGEEKIKDIVGLEVREVEGDITDYIPKATTEQYGLVKIDPNNKINVTDAGIGLSADFINSVFPVERTQYKYTRFADVPLVPCITNVVTDITNDDPDAPPHDNYGYQFYFWNVIQIGFAGRFTQIAFQVFNNKLFGVAFTRSLHDAMWSGWTRLN